MIVNLKIIDVVLVATSLGMAAPDVNANSALLSQVQRAANAILKSGKFFLADSQSIGASISGSWLYPELARSKTQGTEAGPDLRKKQQTHTNLIRSQ